MVEELTNENFNTSMYKQQLTDNQKQLLKMMAVNRGKNSRNNFMNIELQSLAGEGVDINLLDKKHKTIFFNRQMFIDEKIYKTQQKDNFYLACFDPTENEIYFCSFDEEEIIVIDKDSPLRTDIEKELKQRIEEFKKDWLRIKNLSHLDEEEFLSDKSQNYFRRPFNSKFLYPEKLGLNHLTSTYPLPAAFQSYKEVAIEIVIHNSVFEMNELPDNFRFTINRKVGFYYV
jgi:hypothetical protein